MRLESDIADLSASELRRLVGRRELSPVEIVEASLARVERYNGALNAVVTLNESALPRIPSGRGRPKAARTVGARS